MAQENALYAVARIRCHENGLIGRERMARMVQGTANEAMQVLLGAGYGGAAAGDAEQGAAGAEALIAAELRRTYQLVREVSPEPKLTELFLMQADVHNLKVFYKLRLLGGDAAPALMQGGAFDAEALSRMVRDRDYEALPLPLQEALMGLDAASEHAAADPVRVSTALDGAYLTMGYESKNKFAQEYFRAKADFENTLALLRLRAMGAPKEVFTAALLPAGNIEKDVFLKAYEDQEELTAKLLNVGPAGEAIRKAIEGAANAAQQVERARDNYLIRLAGYGRFDQDTVAPIVGYLLAREQEARCIRLVMTAKRNGLPESVITERMRVLYGE
ncbi:MAG: hypothetical protein E7330_08090 [Clostridiales bacterium]|nr:hypothetical protein [Clostridiales bacterium]